MSKAIREAEKRARAREEEKRRTMLRYYEPLPSPPPRHSSPAGNPDRKKVLELLSKLMADEIEAESKYRDAALVAHTAGFPALMRSLNVIASEEAIHRRKISDLISQLEVY